MNSNEKFSAGVSLTNPDDVTSPRANARRKLIRGVFAAPAVMTVCSGSALANTSSLRCIKNQAGGVPVTQPVSGGLDGWVRVQLWTQDDKYFVNGADIDFLKPASATAYLAPTAWQVFDIANNTTGAVGGSRAGKKLSSPAKFAAIRVDGNGNIVGVGATGGGTAIAGTCWTSFKLAA